MLECKSIKCNGESSLYVAEIPEVHISSLEELADACCCTLFWNSKNSVTVYGSSSEILNFESEVLALVARITFLENCLRKS